MGRLISTSSVYFFLVLTILNIVLIDSFAVFGSWSRKVSSSVSMTATEVVKPVPKVPTTAWRWPTSWPFPDDFLTVVENKTEDAIGGFSPQVRSKVSDHLVHFLFEDCNVLEIGSDAESVLPQSSLYDLCAGVAITEDALSKCQTRVVKTDINSDETLPYYSRTFDLVITSDSLTIIILMCLFSNDIEGGSIKWYRASDKSKGFIP